MSAREEGSYGLHPASDDPNEVAGRVDAIYVGSEPWVVDQALLKVLPRAFCDWETLGDPQTPRYERAAAIALSYRIQVMSSGRKRRVTATPFLQGGLGPSPLELRDLDQDVVGCWTVLLQHGTAPEFRAHLHALLFLRGFDGGNHARAAALDYLEAAQRQSESMTVVDQLELALQLAIAIKDQEVIHRVTQHMLELAEAELSGSAHTPGVVFGLIRPLVATGLRTDEVRNLLHAAQSRYRDHPWNQHTAIEMGLQTAVAEEVPVLQNAAVECWLDAGRNSEGLVRSSHFKRALEVARSFARRDLETLAAQHLESVTREELGLEAHWVSIGVDRRQLLEKTRPITDAGSLAAALYAYSVFGPVTGDLDANRRSAIKMAQDAPLLHIVTHVILGADGLPRLELVTPEDREAFDLAQVEELNLKVYGPVLAEALSRVPKEGVLPSESEIVDALIERPLMDEQEARALARSLLRYWTHDFDGAALSVWPLVEAFARKLVIRANLGVYRLQVKEKPGQYPGLGFLLEVLKDLGLDPNWHRFLYSLCVNPMGLNLRNDLAHGFNLQPSALVAAVLIQGVLYLSTLDIRARQNGAEDGGLPG